MTDSTPHDYQFDSQLESADGPKGPPDPNDQSGRVLGPYKLTRLLGRGGMGEVYQATDTRLDRNIAIKLLRAEVVQDAARKARFEREAKALAALQHPGIVTIYSIETIEGVTLITMEFVKGRTLSRLLKGDKQLPVERVIELGLPIADALSAAHKQGIVHRDVKPDNIIVGKQGEVTVLDFGLSKLTSPVLEDLDPDDAVTQVSSATVEGRILGTVHYMSPEQAQGEAMTTSTDVFSLGVVLYEMATGTSPFEGETTLSRLSSMLKDEPEQMRQLNADIPDALDRVVRRCLVKDPDRRWQTATDVRNELELVRDGTGEAAAAKPATAPGAGRRVLAVVLMLIVAAAGFWAGGRGLVAPGGSTSLSGGAGLPASAVSLDAPAGHEVLDVAMSPDGRTAALRIAPQQTSSLQDVRYFMRSLDSFDMTPIAGSKGAVYGRFSPDSRSFVFLLADGRADQAMPLMRMELDSAARPVQIGAVSHADAGLEFTDSVSIQLRGFSWLDSATIATASQGEPTVTLINARTGDVKHEVTLSFDGKQRIIRMLGPIDEKTLLVATDRYTEERYLQEVFWANIETGETGLLVSQTSEAAVAGDDAIVFSRGETLYAIDWNKAARAVTGEARPMLSGLRTTNTWNSALFQLSDTGALAYLPGGMQGAGRTLWRHDLTGEPVQHPMDPAAFEERIAVSADGKTLLVTTTDLSDGMWSVSKGTLSPPRMRTHLRDAARDVFHPVHARDGSMAAVMTHTSRPTRRTSIQVFDPNSSEPPREVLEADDTQLLTLAISARLDEVLYASSSMDVMRGTLNVASIEGDPTPRVLISDTARYVDAAWSPDGEMLAWISDASGHMEAYVAPYGPEGLGQVQLASDGTVTALGWVEEGGGLLSLRMIGDQKETSRAVTKSGGRVALGPIEATGRVLDARAGTCTIDLDGGIHTIRKGDNEVPADRVQLILHWANTLK